MSHTNQAAGPGSNIDSQPPAISRLTRGIAARNRRVGAVSKRHESSVGAKQKTDTRNVKGDARKRHPGGRIQPIGHHACARRPSHVRRQAPLVSWTILTRRVVRGGPHRGDPPPDPRRATPTARFLPPRAGCTFDPNPPFVFCQREPGVRTLNQIWLPSSCTAPARSLSRGYPFGAGRHDAVARVRPKDRHVPLTAPAQLVGRAARPPGPPRCTCVRSSSAGQCPVESPQGTHARNANDCGSSRRVPARKPACPTLFRPIRSGATLVQAINCSSRA